jgi:hypothetical protein
MMLTVRAETSRDVAAVCSVHRAAFPPALESKVVDRCRRTVRGAATQVGGGVLRGKGNADVDRMRIKPGTENANENNLAAQPDPSP